jgi:hypothetical protein
MAKKKKELRMARNYFVHHLDMKTGSAAVEEISSEIDNKKCENPFCKTHFYDQGKRSHYGIQLVREKECQCSIMFLSTEWCCNSFMNEIHGICVRGLSRHFSDSDVVSKPNHFYQE